MGPKPGRQSDLLALEVDMRVVGHFLDDTGQGEEVTRRDEADGIGRGGALLGCSEAERTLNMPLSSNSFGGIVAISGGSSVSGGS